MNWDSTTIPLVAPRSIRSDSASISTDLDTHTPRVDRGVFFRAVRASEQGPSAELCHGDWLEAVQTLEAGTVDLVYVDPPFNTGKAQTGRAGRYEDRWASTGAFVDWLGERLSVTVPLLKETGSILLHLDQRTSHLARCVLDDLLGADRFVNHLIWRYGLGGSSPRRFARKHDDILFYCVDPERYWFEPPMVPATSQRLKGQMKKATDVLDVPAINNMAGERVGYPTQKPLSLLDLLVRACCPPGGVVLDPCCGSGTTLVAGFEAGRRVMGVDQNSQAITVAGDRLADARIR